MCAFVSVGDDEVVDGLEVSPVRLVLGRVEQRFTVLVRARHLGWMDL